MTRAAYEASLSEGRPVELYEFRYGPGTNDFYRYTNCDHQIDVALKTFDPLAIKRGSISASGTLDKTALTINLPTTAPICELFRVYAPSYVVTLTIYEGHENDPDGEFAVVWVGRVLSCNRKSGERFMAALTCEPASTSMKRPGLRRRYQFSCPHVLYGSKCGVDPAAFTVSPSVVGVSGTTVTLASGWSAPHDYTKFPGGLFTYVDDTGLTCYRTVLRVPSPTTLALSGVPFGLDPGQTVLIQRGCNHQTDQCKNDFSNILNFGGDPWIPLKNPIQTNPFTVG